MVLNKLITFTLIVREMTDNVSYFQQSVDCTREVGISPLMNCSFAIRQLAYVTVSDALDEYLQIGGKNSHDCLNAFFKEVMDLYRKEFL